MVVPGIDFHSQSSFDAQERATLERLARAVAALGSSKSASLLTVLRENVRRAGAVGEALAVYPPVFAERTLGDRQRNRDTLVDLLAAANEASIEMFLPTRAMVGRALVYAELNVWRLAKHIHDEALDEPELRREIDHWLHGCVYTLLAEDVLLTIAMDTRIARRIRDRAVESLCRFWESRHVYGARHFFPVLAETWAARRRIRVSLGTLLGISEIFRLLQAGCDEQFVDYFSRDQVSEEEGEAFQEFLIGVPTEAIHSLAQLMEKQGQHSLAPEQVEMAASPLESGAPLPEAVRFYQFFRSRYLQAAARRLKDLPGPKRTAEEFVMIWFLDRETR